LNLNIITGNLTISSRKLVSTTFLNSGVLAWFFLFQVYLPDILTNIVPDRFWVEMGMGIFFAFGILSAIIGSFIAERIDRKKFFFTWIFLGILSTLLLAVIQGILLLLIACVLLGLSLGFGLPKSMAFLADSSTIEERGRISGIVILETFIIAFLTIAIIEILGESILTMILSISIIRMASYIALIFGEVGDKPKKEKSSSYKIAYKEFAFYVFPWIMFVIAGGLASNLVPKTEQYLSAISLGTIFRYAFIAIFGIIWGTVADRIGRKTPIIIGLTMLGVGFALLGFAMSPNAVLFYLIISGIAWGSFLPIYLVIPGDLSSIGSREKSYALVFISPLIILFSLSMLDPTFITTFSESAFSQILSVLLFLSIIPILRAKETLQESKIRQRKMKEYAGKVAKIVQESKKL
jgi:MFS family permease